MKFTNRAYFFGVEVTEDTDPVLVGTNAILTTGIELQPYAGDKISRDLDQPYLGAQAQVNVNPHMGVRFGVELASAGAAGDSPAFDALLQVCGLDPTVTASTDVTYNLLSDAIKSGTGYFMRGTQLHKHTGVRGSMGWELTAGQIPRFNFDSLLGSYISPATVSAITPDYSGFVAPSSVTKDNTPTVTVDGYTACMQRFSGSLNNQVSRRNLPNCRSTIIGDRSISGQIVVKAPDLATKDFFTELESHAGISFIPIVIEHGATAGAKVNFSLPNCQLADISETDIDGELGYQIDWVAVPTAAGNDELVLKFL